MKMHTENVHYRHALLHHFKNDKRAVKVIRKICSVCGNDVVTERLCQKGFTKFRFGNFNINDALHSARPTEIYSSDDKAILDGIPYQTMREMSTTLNIPGQACKIISTNWDTFPASMFGCYIN